VLFSPLRTFALGGDLALVKALQRAAVVEDDPFGPYGDDFSDNFCRVKMEYSRCLTQRLSRAISFVWADWTSSTWSRLSSLLVTIMKSMSLVRSKSPIASEPSK
jgi:hypothetical protein